MIESVRLEKNSKIVKFQFGSWAGGRVRPGNGNYDDKEKVQLMRCEAHSEEVGK